MIQASKNLRLIKKTARISRFDPSIRAILHHTCNKNNYHRH